MHLVPFFTALLASSAYAHSSDSLGKRAPDGTQECGPGNGGASCKGGFCCSQRGYCGTGPDYCAAGCQPAYGLCQDDNWQGPINHDSLPPRPQLGSIPVGGNIVHCTTPGKVALTFDDGPSPYTSQLLDVLDKNNVKATFFIVGNNAYCRINDTSGPCPGLLKRMWSSGHQIGSHSYTHPNFDTLTSAQRIAELSNNEVAFYNTIGYVPTIFRPPFTTCGAPCTSDVANRGYRILNYDVDTRDWQLNYNYAQNQFIFCLRTPNPGHGWISLAHDTMPLTVQNFAQFMIDHARSMGFTLTLIGDCLNDPIDNWYRDYNTGVSWKQAPQAQAGSPTSATASAKPSTTNPPNQAVSSSTSTSSTSTLVSTSTSTSMATSASSSTPSTTTSTSTAPSSSLATSSVLTSISQAVQSQVLSSTTSSSKSVATTSKSVATTTTVASGAGSHEENSMLGFALSFLVAYLFV